jgi:hypothetical protein
VAPQVEDLGVECVTDCCELLPSDLAEMGLRPLETRRFERAVAQLGGVTT